jgi:hypothetical protein
LFGDRSQPEIRLGIDPPLRPQVPQPVSSLEKSLTVFSDKHSQSGRIILRYGRENFFDFLSQGLIRQSHAPSHKHGGEDHDWNRCPYRSPLHRQIVFVADDACQEMR